jgi:hypothetical protein
MSWIIGLLIFFAFLFFLFSFPKQTLGCLGVIVVSALLLYYLLIHQPEQTRKHLGNQVVVSVSYTVENCTKKYPLLVRIHNKSSKTVTKVHWDLGVYQPGYSTDLAGYADYSSDKILKPGEKWQSCYTLPRDIASRVDQERLEYRISGKYVTFE